MKVTLDNKWTSIIFYVLIFFLFREWLLPVMELTDTSSPLKVLYIAWVVIYIYANSIMFSAPTIHFLINDLLTNGKALIFQDWNSVTDSFRTILFFALIWMTAYLIHHWISIRLNIFLFFFMTGSQTTGCIRRSLRLQSGQML